MRDDDKTSAEIERDVEVSRARLENTLGDIRERMTAGQIVDEIFAYAKTSGGGEMTRNLGRSIRENPLPLLLVGAGIGWMMLGGGAASDRRRAWQPADGEDYGQGRWAGWENGHRGPPPQAGGYGDESDGPGLVGRVAAGVGRAGEAVGNAASAAYHGVADAVHGVTGAAEDVAAGVGRAGEAVGSAASYAYRGVAGAARGAAGAADGVAHAAGRAGSYADRMAGSVAHGANDVAGTVRHEAEHVGQWTRDGWRYLAEEQPLVLAAIGVAIGAAVGAAIPSTGIENRAMGESAAEIKRTVGDVASRQVDKAKELVEDAYEGVTEELDKQHLTDAAVGAIDAVAERVREAVSPEGETSDGDEQGGARSV